jgi:hypothetical protein
MTMQKNLTLSNSSIVVRDLNEFLRANNLIHSSYCRVFEYDRILITICYGGDDIGTVHYHLDEWKFDYLLNTKNESEKLTLFQAIIGMMKSIV